MPGYVAEVLAQTGTGAVATTSDSYNAVPDANLTVTVPSGETDKLVVFFSAEDACYGGDSLERCRLKITVDGNELSPAAGGDAYFDNNDRGQDKSGGFDSKNSGDQASRAIVRTSANLAAGTHTVQTQYSTTDSGTAFQLDDWALVVQRVKVS